jgi:hypothetical protein
VTAGMGRARALLVACALCASVASVPSAGATAPSPGPGYKDCGSIAAGGTHLELYARHLGCRKALRVQRGYEHGPFASEPGWNELCLKRLPGWCCGGGGGSDTCRKGRSSVAAWFDPEGA